MITNPPVATAAPSPGAARMRRHRWLRRQGAFRVSLVVGADAIEKLMALGWLAPGDPVDRDALAGAVIAQAANAIELRPKP